MIRNIPGLLFIVMFYVISCTPSNPHTELKVWNKLRTTSSTEFSEYFQFAYCHTKSELFDSVCKQMNSSLLGADDFIISFEESYKYDKGKVYVEIKQQAINKAIVNDNIKEQLDIFLNRKNQLFVSGSAFEFDSLKSYLQYSILKSVEGKRVTVPYIGRNQKLDYCVKINTESIPTGNGAQTKWTNLYSILQVTFSSLKDVRDDYASKIWGTEYELLDDTQKLLVRKRYPCNIEIQLIN